MVRWACALPFLLSFLPACGGGGGGPAEPLVIEFLAPSADARVPLGASVPVAVRVTPAHRLATVEILASVGGAETPIASIADAGGEHSFTWRTAGLPYGAYRLVARTTSDGAQAEAESPATIVLDAPPEVTVLEPAADDAPEGAATIRYLDDDPDSAALTTLYADGDGDLGTTTDRLVVRGAQPDGSGASRTVTWDLAGVPAGAYTIVAIIDDGVNPPATSASSGRIHVLGGLAATAPGVAGAAVSDSTIYSDQTMGIAAYGDGSFVVAGHFSGEATWGAGQPNETRIVAAGDQDIFVARYDATGALLWVRTAGGGKPDRALAVAAFPDGSCVVTGGVRDGAVFGPGETALGNHVFYARYDVDGNLLWMHSVSTSFGRGTCLAPLADGGFLVGGWFYRGITFDWDHTSTRIRLESATDGLPDGFLARCGPDGRVIWARMVDAVLASEVRGVAAFADGSCVATGAFMSGAAVNALEPDAVELTSPWGSPLLVDRCFVARWDANGGLLWARAPGGTSSHAGCGIIARKDGSAIVTGYFFNYGSIAIQAPENHIIFDGIRLDAPIATDQGFAACYGPTGAVAWARLAGPDDRYFSVNGLTGRPSSIVPLEGGGFAVAGGFWGTRKFGSETVKSAGGSDLYVARYSPDGALTGFETAGGPGDDLAYALAVAPQGWLMLGGKFEGAVAIGSGTIESAGTGPQLLIARVPGH